MPRAAGDAWRTIPALMDEAEKRGVKFPRKGAIVRPQKHSSEWRVNVTQVKNAQGRARRRHQRRRIERRRNRRPPAGDGTFSNSCAAKRPALPMLMSSTSRRSSACAKPAASPATINSPPTMCSPAPAFDDTIGVNGWPIENHAPATSNGAGPISPARAASITCPTACWCRAALDNLLVAGRCASMTHEGQSAARVSGGCFVMGQAAGTAAHLSLAGNAASADIPRRPAAGHAGKRRRLSRTRRRLKRGSEKAASRQSNVEETP